MKYLVFTFCLFVCLQFSTLAKVNTPIEQTSTEAEAINQVEMADVMRSNGKIYVVVAVILSIFAGIVVYTVMIDRKITKMEKGGQQ